MNGVNNKAMLLIHAISSPVPALIWMMLATEKTIRALHLCNGGLRINSEDTKGARHGVQRSCKLGHYHHKTASAETYAYASMHTSASQSSKTILQRDHCHEAQMC